MERNDRLRQVFKYLQRKGVVLTQKEFGKSIGKSEVTISKAMKGEQKALTKSLMSDVCITFPEISLDWLTNGTGSMLTTEHSASAADKEPGSPYYDVDFEGGFTEIINSQTRTPVSNIVVSGFERADLWCNVTGHSMEPKINHGDIIALRQCTIDDVQYGEIYAVVLDTIRTIKILRRASTPDAFLYVPINTDDFDPQEYPKSRIINIFEVIGSISKFF